MGSYVFIDRRPVLIKSEEYEPIGPILEDSVTTGASATISPEGHIGKGFMINSGSLVIKDVPPLRLTFGASSRFESLPDRLAEE